MYIVTFNLVELLEVELVLYGTRSGHSFVVELLSVTVDFTMATSAMLRLYLMLYMEANPMKDQIIRICRCLMPEPGHRGNNLTYNTRTLGLALNWIRLSPHLENAAHT